MLSVVYLCNFTQIRDYFTKIRGIAKIGWEYEMLAEGFLSVVLDILFTDSAYLPASSREQQQCRTAYAARISVNLEGALGQPSKYTQHLPAAARDPSTRLSRLATPQIKKPFTVIYLASRCGATEAEQLALQRSQEPRAAGRRPRHLTLIVLDLLLFNFETNCLHHLIKYFL